MTQCNRCEGLGCQDCLSPEEFHNRFCGHHPECTLKNIPSIVCKTEGCSDLRKYGEYCSEACKISTEAADAYDKHYNNLLAAQMDMEWYLEPDEMDI